MWFINPAGQLAEPAVSVSRPKILVMIPMKPNLHHLLRMKAFRLAEAMVAANPVVDLAIYFDFHPERGHASDKTAWSRVTRVRNRLLLSIDLSRFTHLLWIDADVVEYPPDLPTRLFTDNPHGVAAPLILIEGTETFYDRAAFVIAGQDKTFPDDPTWVNSRHLTHEKPYWPEEPKSIVVQMDCVGTITLVNVDVYLAARVTYEDHPRFTDHYPICVAARSLGRSVTVSRDIVCYHANLPLYGESFH